MEYVFETDHLRTRRFRPDDASRLYENHLEEEVRIWIPNESYQDMDEAREAAAFFASCVEAGQLPFVLAVEHKDTCELIGDVGVNEVEDGSGGVEIGYTICSSHSGKGYATELVRAMTDLIFSRFDVRTVYGRVMRGNEASVKVLLRNGYSFEKEELDAPDDPYKRGMLVYRKTLL